MFERLLHSLGKPDSPQTENVGDDGELVLAAAKILYAVLPVDYVVTNQEAVALRMSLMRLFEISPDRCRRLIARAAAAHAKDTSILAAATLLKHRTSDAFRKQLCAEVNLLIHADGVVHDNEADLENRVSRLLGFGGDYWKKSG
jgi:uncharacterized tellurite resistance protein B-like protein